MKCPHDISELKHRYRLKSGTRGVFAFEYLECQKKKCGRHYDLARNEIMLLPDRKAYKVIRGKKALQ